MVEPESEDKHQILASSSLSLSGARVLKHGETFAVFDRFGDIRPYGVLGAQGLYHEGSRFVAALELRLGGARPLLLSSNVREDNLLFAVDLMCPDIVEAGRIVVPHGTLHVLRKKFLWQGVCYEHLRISNFGPATVETSLAFSFGADFVDVFQVRGTPRRSMGELGPPERTNDGIRLAYDGKDGVRRVCRLRVAPVPDRIRDAEATLDLRVESKRAKDVYVTITCDTGSRGEQAPPPFEAAYVEAGESLRRLKEATPDIVTSNEHYGQFRAGG
jgi:glycogen debranching enzyme